MRVVELPGALLCETCGYVMQAEPFQKGQKQVVIRCTDSRCTNYEIPVVFRLTVHECHEAPPNG